jgi:hypothetical protein
MRIHSLKAKRKRDSGETSLGVLAAIGIAALISVGGTIIYVNANNSHQQATALESKKSTISDTMNRTSQAVQVADPILFAKGDELVVQRKDATGNITRTRWVKKGTTLYQQQWSGISNDYPATTQWIAETTMQGTAPNGDGTQTSTKVLTDVTQAILYKYFDKDEVAIQPTGAAVANPLDIRRVDVELQANAISGKAASSVVNETKVAVRNGDGGFSDGSVGAPTCPAVTFDAASAAAPKLNWGVIAGVTSYEIRRNDIAVTTVTVPAASATGTWTDTAATPGVAINYQVLGKDATGTLSQSCRTVTWRVQVAAPVLKDATVLPKGTEASAWSTAPDNLLETPRVSLKWSAVPGATGYQILYRLLTSAGAPTTPDFQQLTGTTLPATTTSFIWDGCSWGARYEFFVQATSKGAGSSDSRHIQILTHPKTPSNVDVSPAYGTGANKTVNGFNNLSWDASVTAARYEVWRYDAGSSGAASLAGTTTGTTFTDTVPYGSTYTYYVAAKNFGPRGTDAAGVDVSAFRSSPNPESSVDDTSPGAVGVSFRDNAGAATTNASAVYRGNATVTTSRASVAMAVDPNSPKPKVVSQLQYPPIPAVTAPSLSGFATRDLDGSNRIVWAAAKSATGYQVRRFTASGSSSKCLTSTACAASGGITATSYTDPAAEGTRFDYGVIAYNATGLSVQVSAGVELIQRPAAPPLNVTAAPSLSTPSASFSSTANADAGQPLADRFCTYDDCKYRVLRNGVVQGSINHLTTGQTINFNDYKNPEGQTLTWTIQAKNGALTNGGWSDTTAKVVNTYPGDFGISNWLGDANGNQEQRFKVDLTNTDTSGSSVAAQQAGHTSTAWGNSVGASTMRMRRVPGGNEATSWDSSTWLPSPGIPDVTAGPGANWWTGWAAPGTTYFHELTATAPNGLQRKKNSNILRTPPDLPIHGTTIITCSKPTRTAWAKAGHVQGVRLQDFQYWPRYGGYSRTNVMGLTWWQGQSWATATGTEGNWYPGQAQSDWINGPGYQYYYGQTNGFDITTVGQAGHGNSITIRQSITAWDSFYDGCSWDGARWWDLWEPTYACYGYTPGQPTCTANNPWNRPQWRTR